jgi:hypothetical protein
MGARPRRPDNAEITIAARVRARQLRFVEVPQISTEFSGMPGHESASGSNRVHLPQHVEKNVTYRHVRVDYRLAAALVLPGNVHPWWGQGEQARKTRQWLTGILRGR